MKNTVLFLLSFFFLPGCNDDEQTDKQDNESPKVIDTTAPTAPVIDLDNASDTGMANDDNITSDKTSTFTITNYKAVTDVDNVSVKWFIDDVEQAGETNADFTTSELSNGTYTVHARYTDATDNFTNSEALAVTIDATAPTAPVIDLDDASDTGRANDDNVTSDRTPTFIITNYEAVTDADDVTMKWFIDDVEQAGETDATFTMSELMDGTYMVTAQFMDVSGNMTGSNAITVVIKAEDDQTFPKNIAFTTISNGVLSGSGSEGIAKSEMVINNTNDWQDLIAKMNSVNNLSDNFSETNIDFDKHLVIAIFDKYVKPHYNIVEINSVTEKQNKINIYYTITGSAATVVIPGQGFHIVKISQTTKPIEFDNGEDDSMKIEFIEIGKGFTGVNNDISQNLIITSQEDWNKSLNYFSGEIIEEFSKITINFKEYIIVGIITNNKSDTGYSVTINEILDSDNSVNVYSEMSNSGSGYTIIVQPFHIVKIPRTHKPIEFK